MATRTHTDLYALPQEFLDLREMIRQVATEKIAPRAHDIDATAEYPHDLREILAENGILGLPFDEEYGGTGTGILMLSLAGERNRQNFASGAGLHHVDGRVFHGQFTAQVAIDPFHCRIGVGHGSFGDEVVDVVGPVLDRCVSAAATPLADDFYDR